MTKRRTYAESRGCTSHPRLPLSHLKNLCYLCYLCDINLEVLDDSSSYSRQLLHLPDGGTIL